MESNITFYLMIYLAIIGIALLFLLSPLALYLSFRLLRITGKRTLLISLVLSIPCLGLLSLPEIFGLNPRVGYPAAGFLSLIYFTFLFRKMFKGSLSKSIGLSLSYGLANTLSLVASLFILSLISRDQPLEPATREWLTQKPPSIVDSDNLYFALIGFNADPDVDPHQAGLQCIREYNEYAQKKAIPPDPESSLPPVPSCLVSKFPSPDKTFDDLCDAAQSDCFRRLRSEQNRFDALIQKYQFLIDRYIALSHYAGYGNIAVRGLETPLIQAGSMLKTHKLFISRTALDYLKGRRPEALAALRRDIEFQRRNMIHADNLLFLMLSTGLLNRDLYLYSQFLDQDVEEKSYQKELEIPLLSGKEKSIAHALQGEFQFLSAVHPEGYSDLNINPVKKFPRHFQEIYFKPNDMLNRNFRIFKSIMAWSELPADKLSSSKIKMPASPGFWETGYNPEGVILLAVAAPMSFYDSYVYRLHNLDGLIRLVKIKQRIRHDRIARDRIESFLKQDLPYCKNPYTNQPMTWDAQTATLYFVDPSKEEQKVAVNIPFSVK